MRILFAVIALAASGCAAPQLVGAMVGAAAVQSTVKAANAPPPERSETDETRMARYQELSRKRLYPPEGPHCAVNVVPTGSRTWQLRSCDGETRCWALSEGFDCDPPRREILPVSSTL